MYSGPREIFYAVFLAASPVKSETFGSIKIFHKSNLQSVLAWYCSAAKFNPYEFSWGSATEAYRTIIDMCSVTRPLFCSNVTLCKSEYKSVSLGSWFIHEIRWTMTVQWSSVRAACSVQSLASFLKSECQLTKYADGSEGDKIMSIEFLCFENLLSAANLIG